MREIKFRAWDKRKHKMCQVYSIILGSGAVSLWDIEESGKPSDWVMPKDMELMQYTGLKDRNGVEIYEGDVVEHYGLIGEVRYERAMFIETAHNAPLESNVEVLEVIGNVWENPELLKQKEDASA